MRHFTHEASALFQIRGRRVVLSIPTYMTFHSPSIIAVKRAWFNPDTQKVEVEMDVKEKEADPREISGRNKNETEYI
jgi:hypothetical protein